MVMLPGVGGWERHDTATAPAPPSGIARRCSCISRGVTTPLLARGIPLVGGRMSYNGIETFPIVSWLGRAETLLHAPGDTTPAGGQDEEPDQRPDASRREPPASRHGWRQPRQLASRLPPRVLRLRDAHHLRLALPRRPPRALPPPRRPAGRRRRDPRARRARGGGQG